MDENTVLAVLSVLVETAKNAGAFFMVLPLPVQLFIGIITLIITGKIIFQSWVLWQRLKALRYGRINW